MDRLTHMWVWCDFSFFLGRRNKWILSMRVIRIPNAIQVHLHWLSVVSNSWMYKRVERIYTGFSKGMSKRLDLRFFLSWDWEICLRKYFWAWLATWVGVFVVTNFLDIPLQFPFPSSFSPAKKVLCSSSVHGFPANELRRHYYTPTNHKK